jgi:hypothetical protein
MSRLCHERVRALTLGDHESRASCDVIVAVMDVGDAAICAKVFAWI